LAGSGAPIDRAPSGGGDGADRWRRLKERTEGAKIMAWNLPCGHGQPNLTLPLGAWARLDPAANALVVIDRDPVGTER
jgi:hypothetical protein